MQIPKAPRLAQISSGSALGLGLGHSQSSQSYIEVALALRPSPATCRKLCEAFLTRVDALVRLFHRPSLLGFLLEDKQYLNYHAADPVLDALRSTVFFITVVSLNCEQCPSIFDTDKTALVSTYRAACEVAFERVGLVTTEDVTVLQSFVMYLVCILPSTHVAANCFSMRSAHTTAVVLLGRSCLLLHALPRRFAFIAMMNTLKRPSLNSSFDGGYGIRCVCLICILPLTAAQSRSSSLNRPSANCR